MIYLYLKQHNKTGLKYLGFTRAKCPFKYKGSGKYWKRHINKHGYDVTTTILLQSIDQDEILAEAKILSIKWDIVQSHEFANLKPEEGDGGFAHIYLDRTTYLSMWQEKGRKLGLTVKGHTVVKDDEGRLTQVAVDDPRLISGELVGSTKGSVTLYDEFGKRVRSPTGSASSILKGNNNGKRYITNGIENKMLARAEVLPDGWWIGDSRINPNQNKKWITNGSLSKMVMDNDAIPTGWWRGRTRHKSI